MPVVSLEDEHEVSINSTRGKSTSRGVLPSDFENLRMALSAKQGNVQHQQTPEASVSDMQVSILDESLLREKLVHLIKDHFRNQNSAPEALEYWITGKRSLTAIQKQMHRSVGNSWWLLRQGHRMFYSPSRTLLILFLLIGFKNRRSRVLEQRHAEKRERKYTRWKREQSGKYLISSST